MTEIVPYLNAKVLASSIRRAIVDNPRTRAAMTTPPTVTVGASAPGSTVVYPGGAPAIPADWNPTFRTYGGWKVQNSNAVYARAVTVDASLPVDRTAYNTNAAGVQNFTEFYTDAPVFTIRIVGAAITGNWATIKLLVNGQYVSVTGHVLTVGSFGNNYVTVDFSSAGGRALRRIGVETADANAISFIYVDALSTVFAPPEDELPPIIVQTDSYGVGLGASAAIDSFAAQLRHYLGYPNIVVNAVSSTGMLARVSPKLNNSLDRINAGDISALNPAAIISCMGVNDASRIGDATITRAAYQAQIPLVLAGLRASAPNAPVAIFGPWTPNGPPQTNVGQVDDDLAAAVATFNDPRCFNVRSYRRYGYNYPTVVTAKPVLWGAGSTGTPVGSGPNDLYVAADNTHVLSAGHGILAQWIATEFAAGLAALAA